MYPADKMKKSESGGKIKPPAKKAEETTKNADEPAKDEKKKEETPKATEKKVETPKAVEKKQEAPSESTEAFAAAALTEKLAGNAPVEGIP